jgi:hypothetical protein
MNEYRKERGKRVNLSYQAAISLAPQITSPRASTLNLNLMEIIEFGEPKPISMMADTVS